MLNAEKRIDPDVNIKKKIMGRPLASIPTFPSHTLKDTMKIIEGIDANYAGDPTDTIDVSKLVGMPPQSRNFRNLLVSSGRYGITKGSIQAKTISITDLGKKILQTDSEQYGSNILTALKRSDTFANFLAKYDRKKLPKPQIIEDVLEKIFGIDPDRAGDCASILISNIRDWELVDEGVLRLSLLESRKPQNKLSKKTAEENFDEITKSETAEENFDEITKSETAEENFDEITKSETAEEKSSEITGSKKTDDVETAPIVFVSHSKNKKILEQIKKILTFGEIKYSIAEEEKTTAIPIPDKISQIMRSCNCAIINVSADEEMKQEDNSYAINENVLIEIGAAFVHYDKRVILLVDKRLELPSNLQGLSRCGYDGNELSFEDAMNLQDQILEFKKLLK